MPSWPGVSLKDHSGLLISGSLLSGIGPGFYLGFVTNAGNNELVQVGFFITCIGLGWILITFTSRLINPGFRMVAFHPRGNPDNGRLGIDHRRKPRERDDPDREHRLHQPDHIRFISDPVTPGNPKVITSGSIDLFSSPGILPG